MKIETSRGVASTTGARRGDAAVAAPGFAPAMDAPQRTSAAAPTNAVTPLDAIIALQSEEGPAQRRARQARRGKDALDALEGLEQGLLSGRAPPGLRADMEALHRAAEPTGEPQLDAVLLEIDVRLAVELAKLDRLERAR